MLEVEKGVTVAWSEKMVGVGKKSREMNSYLFVYQRFSKEYSKIKKSIVKRNFFIEIVCINRTHRFALK